MGAGPPTGKGATVADDSMICIGCCLHIANRRGLCDWCHRRTRCAVAEGKTTWAELERLGLVLTAEPWDSDTEEEERPGLAADLVGWFILFVMGLVFAGIGLLLWAPPRWDPFRNYGILLLAIGVGTMLFAVKLAVDRSCGRAPPRARG
jgi:hypothetical protein